METMIERLQTELEAARAELKEHMASWAYAFAMGGRQPTAGKNHPVARLPHASGRSGCRRAATTWRARLADI